MPRCPEWLAPRFVPRRLLLSGLCRQRAAKRCRGQPTDLPVPHTNRQIRQVLSKNTNGAFCLYCAALSGTASSPSSRTRSEHARYFSRSLLVPSSRPMKIHPFVFLVLRGHLSILFFFFLFLASYFPGVNECGRRIPDKQQLGRMWRGTTGSRKFKISPERPAPGCWSLFGWRPHRCHNGKSARRTMCPFWCSSEYRPRNDLFS